MIETSFCHHYKASIILYHIIPKPQFLNLRLMPHLVVRGHICQTWGSLLLVRRPSSESYRKYNTCSSLYWMMPTKNTGANIVRCLHFKNLVLVSIILYTGEGMDETEFTEAEINMNDLVSKYQQYPVPPLKGNLCNPSVFSM